tara:strand:- start:115339 stop:116622 length:1284 start_codon:yes stop_codon:yes gene_type:complete
MKKLTIIALLLLLYACNSESDKKTITNPSDYNKYLKNDSLPTKVAVDEEMVFWQERVDNNDQDFVAMSKLADLNTALFGVTGDVSKLYVSENLTKKVHDISVRNRDTYLRSLAHNYISQHRFKEAQILLDSAYTYSDNKRATELMLFDVAMELGDYTAADMYLGKVQKPNDYNYLIRLSKWSDYRGDLDSAIKYMEQAKKIAEAGGIKSLKVWTYSNLADYYGHAGRIKDSYDHYLKTLQLEPDNSYAKKGIAWIVYSSEKNTEEANRILDSIMQHHKVPDYFLLKAEMAEYDGNLSEAKAQKENFIKAVQFGNYGNIYNTYVIELFSETDPRKALALAEQEVENRATPETYHILAYAQLRSGNKAEALKTIITHVEGKTHEPMAAYHSALIYEANGLSSKLEEAKEELLEASYELGPVLTNEIKEW